MSTVTSGGGVRMMELSPRESALVTTTVASMIHALDGRRWAEVLSYFAERVETDYTSLFGGEVQTQASRDLVAGWEKLLGRLSATQHLLGPIVVTGSERTAHANCHVRGYHFQPRAASGPEWMVAGHYAFELEQGGASWLITKMKLHASYQTGNLKLLSET